MSQQMNDYKRDNHAELRWVRGNCPQTSALQCTHRFFKTIFEQLKTKMNYP